MKQLSEDDLRNHIKWLQSLKNIYLNESSESFDDDRDHRGFKMAMKAEKEDRRIRFLELCIEKKYMVFESSIAGSVTMILFTRDMSRREHCTVAMKGSIQFGMHGKWYQYSENAFHELLSSRGVTIGME